MDTGQLETRRGGEKFKILHKYSQLHVLRLYRGGGVHERNYYNWCTMASRVNYTADPDQTGTSTPWVYRTDLSIIQIEYSEMYVAYVIRNTC